jgi:glycine cleavage system H lipoate-binding protein
MSNPESISLGPVEKEWLVKMATAPQGAFLCSAIGLQSGL